MRCGCGALVLLPWVLLVVDAQVVCWRALMQCQGESECVLAHDQYLQACEAVIEGGGRVRQCPSHCISALIHLNRTRSGPDLLGCDCAMDRLCAGVKQAIEPCLPRRHPSDAGGVGCMEARQRCEEDPTCHASLAAYLSHCGQLFNGRRCPPRCKATIQEMLLIPNGELLNRCVCDGVERPFCEVVKENMGRLCAVGEVGGPTLIPDYTYEDESERDDREEEQTESSCPPHGTPLLVTPLLLWGLILDL